MASTNSATQTAKQKSTRQPALPDGGRYGSIELILGPMFSGKSTELLRRIRRFTYAKRKCLVVKHESDTRYSQTRMSTHDKQQWDSVPIGKLFDLPQAMIDEHDVIGIDEGQFFLDIVEWADKQANRYGKQVIIAALDGSFQRKPFGRVLELVPCCESVVKLNAVCMNCGADAPFTARISAETELEVVGGSDKYIAVCRACHDVETELKTIPRIDTLLSARKKDVVVVAPAPTAAAAAAAAAAPSAAPAPNHDADE